MTQFEKRENQIKELAKSLVLEFMHATSECHKGKKGMRQAQIFRECGFDWGSNCSVAQPPSQQFWIVALLWELKAEGKVEQVSKSGPWRLL